MTTEHPIDATQGLPKLPFGLEKLFVNWLSSRFVLYLYDYVSMKIPGSVRYKQLAFDEITCRFCDHPIELLGAWQCSCGYKRPGTYFGRCPKCLAHPTFVDCPSCGMTMYVR